MKNNRAVNINNWQQIHDSYILTPKGVAAITSLQLPFAYITKDSKQVPVSAFQLKIHYTSRAKIRGLQFANDSNGQFQAYLQSLSPAQWDALSMSIVAMKNKFIEDIDTLLKLALAPPKRTVSDEGNKKKLSVGEQVGWSQYSMKTLLQEPLPPIYISQSQWGKNMENIRKARETRSRQTARRRAIQAQVKAAIAAKSIQAKYKKFDHHKGVALYDVAKYSRGIQQLANYRQSPTKKPVTAKQLFR